ncbi:hypothetical protein Ddc_12150 [Ditylenchus destructor]|nr:hypothetical protein Ddc_12150 [Ditylenchus destructor]
MFPGPRDDDLFTDVGSSFENFNELKQKVFNGAIKGTGNLQDSKGGLKILALCSDPYSDCKKGVSLVGRNGSARVELRFTNDHYVVPGEPPRLLIKDKKNDK